MLSLCRPASHEGRFAIVTNVGCGMRWAHRVAAWFIHADEHPGAHGQAVWSWHPGADAKPCEDVSQGDGGKNAGPRGELGAAVPTIAQGRPVVRLVPVVTAACFFLLQAGHGCGLHPAFPAPSISERAIIGT